MLLGGDKIRGVLYGCASVNVSFLASGLFQEPRKVGGDICINFSRSKKGPRRNERVLEDDSSPSREKKISKRRRV